MIRTRIYSNFEAITFNLVAFLALKKKIKKDYLSIKTRLFSENYI